MTRKPVVLELPEPPNIANARWHWAEKRRRVEAWKDKAWLETLEQCRGRTFYDGQFDRVRVSAHFRLWALMDEDNLTARLKPCLDLFKGHFYEDDSPKHLELGSVTQEISRKNRGLTLTIEPVPSGGETTR